MITSRLLTVALVAVLLLANAFGGDAAGSSASPPLTKKMITHAILSDLAFNAPHLAIDLDAAVAGPDVETLVAAKMLSVAGQTGDGGLAPRGRLILKQRAAQCSNRASVADQSEYARAVIEAINKEGFEELHKRLLLDGNQTITLNPVVQWYSQFLVRMQAPSPPSDCEQAQVRAFTSIFSNVPGRAFDTFEAPTTIRTEIRRFGADERAMTQSWMRVHGGTNTATVFDQFSQSFESGLLADDGGKHAVLGVTIFHQVAALDSSIPFQVISERPLYWNHRGVTGVRMDSTAGGLALYEFGSTEREPILQFVEGLNMSSWRDIVNGFVRRNTNGQNSPQWVAGIRASAPGFLATLEYGRLRVAQATLAVFGVSIAEQGASRPANVPGQQKAQVVPAAHNVYVVVDEKTGAIVFLGADATIDTHSPGSL